MCVCARARARQLIVIFLVEMLNWHDIVYACQSEQTCQDIALVKPDWIRHVSLFRVVYFYLLFIRYWLWTLLQFVWDLRPLIEMHALYRDKLHLEDSDLQIIAWDEIVVKVVELQKTHRVALPGSRPTPSAGLETHAAHPALTPPPPAPLLFGCWLLLCCSRAGVRPAVAAVYCQGPADRPRYRQPDPPKGELPRRAR